MKKLINGIINFRQKSIEKYRNKFSKLASKQTPDALLVACCDSRVVPNVFASSDPGDLFVLRNIGNLIPPHQGNGSEDVSVASAIEFSVVNLSVSDIIICGHSECGAMHALMESDIELNLSSPLNKWLENAAPSYQRFKNNPLTGEGKITQCNCLSRVNVLQQLDNLRTYPIVAEKIKNHTLRVHGWWFDLATADVYYYDSVKNKFIVINEAEAAVIIASLD